MMFIGIALLCIVTKPKKCSSKQNSDITQSKPINPKKQISWIRAALEQLHQAYGLVLWDGI
jgi:hypothetical protein